MQAAQADEMVSCNTLHVVRSGGDAFRQEGLNWDTSDDVTNVSQ